MLCVCLCVSANSTCQGGEWTCSDENCSGTCSVEGGAHINTFDGQIYTIQGDCSYILAKVIHVIYAMKEYRIRTIGVSTSKWMCLHCVFQDKDNRFNVQVKLMKCGLSDYRSCLKEVTLYINSNNEVCAQKKTPGSCQTASSLVTSPSPPGYKCQVIGESVCEQHWVSASTF